MYFPLRNTDSIVEVTDRKVDDVIDCKRTDTGWRDDPDDPFYIVDIGDVVEKFNKWNKELPRVLPFYAVKCNDDPAVLSVLAQLGTGFDAATKGEIESVLNIRVSPDRIIYANPCKQTSHLQYAAQQGVKLMTFDCATELYKIKEQYPDAKLVLRIAPAVGIKAGRPLDKKFGARMEIVPTLLQTALDLDLNIVGISFHVGSWLDDLTAFPRTLALAKEAFNLAITAGYDVKLLDIGGGFPGKNCAKVSFMEVCSTLKPALDQYFPESMGIRIIAEPGTYFVGSAFTLAATVITKKMEGLPNAGEKAKLMYFINDGVFGSFSYVINDPDAGHSWPKVHFQKPTATDRLECACSLWGPTCDSVDLIYEETILPELDIGDWLVFTDMGAYTLSILSKFNNMPVPRCHYIIREEYWLQMTKKGFQALHQPLDENDHRA